MMDEAFAEKAAYPQELIRQFCLDGPLRACRRFGSGTINETYLVQTDAGAYILQKVNGGVFGDVTLLMNNIALVLDAFRQNGYPCAEIVLTREGARLYRTGDDFWRVYNYMEGTESYNTVRDEAMAYRYGRALGRLRVELARVDAAQLYTAIPNVHDTEKRFAAFLAAVRADAAGRAACVAGEIAFVERQQPFIEKTAAAIRDANLPTFAAHNDTRINNLLFRAGEPLCFIDYDTISPGLPLYDFCDAFRCACSPAELENDRLEDVTINLAMLRNFVEGYAAGCARLLTPREAALWLPASRMLLLENGMRMLTDYLQGDTYYQIRYPAHNLDRWKNHRRLLELLDRHADAALCLLDAKRLGIS